MRRLVSISVLLALIIGPVHAEAVLTFKSGETVLRGEIIDSDDTLYRIKTEFGTLSVNVDLVTCTGCPARVSVEEILIHSQPDFADNLAVDLWQAFARRRGLQFEQVATEGRKTLNLRRKDKPIAKVVILPATPTKAYAALIADEADLVLTNRTPTDDEVAEARSVGSGDLRTGRRSFVIGFTKPPDDDPNQTDDCGAKIEQNAFAANSGDNPSVLPALFHLPQRRQTMVLGQFLEFLGTISAKNVVRRHGLIHRFVPNSDFNKSGDRLGLAVNDLKTTKELANIQAASRMLTGKTRLATTLRFQHHTGRFDAIARDSLSQLIRLIKAGALDETKLLIVAFGDGKGRAKRDARRALTALTKLVDLSSLDVTTHSFGDTLNTVCDDTETGEYLNRRIEFWLE